ncbi:MAG: hypothetical protein ACQETV_06390 [Actinomycetota bacterium]
MAKDGAAARRQRWRTITGVALGLLLVASVALSRLGAGVGPDDVVATCEDPLSWTQAGDHVGARGAVAGPVAAVSTPEDVGGEPAFLNLGAAHPDEPRFDVVVYADLREEIALDLDGLEGEVVCAAGVIGSRDGVAQIVVAHPAGLERHDDAGP